MTHPTAEKVSENEPDVTWGIVRSSLLTSGDRRLEAETYLSDGYGRRVSIETRPTGWRPLSGFANVWQPGRLKGITLPERQGTPFLSAGQMFEDRPIARKWLSAERTPAAQDRYVEPGLLLLSCSGTVGRVTLAYNWHANHIITHDLLRIVPLEPTARGWLYAYMRTSSFRQMATGAHYGHMIKHLEPSHVLSLPVVDLDEDRLRHFDDAVNTIYASRNRANDLFESANAIYERAVNVNHPTVDLDEPFTISSAQVMAGRRRLDAYHFNEASAQIQAAMAESAERVDKLVDVTAGVWWPNRFSRAFGANGTPYASAVELFDLNAPITKRIYAGLVANASRYFVEPGWLLMARSGQIYGLNGRVLMVGQRQTKFFVSEDLIRIVPNERAIRPGYLMMVLGHPSLGRPNVLRNAYGTSIPHLEPADLVDIPVPRFASHVEDQIATLVEEAVGLNSTADDSEDQLVQEAENIIEAFLHSDFWQIS